MSLTRRIARNVGSIPSGYVLGRASGGFGPTELLNPTEAVRSANFRPRSPGTVTSIGLYSALGNHGFRQSYDLEWHDWPKLVIRDQRPGLCGPNRSH
jgi:hypothetical protein